MNGGIDPELVRRVTQEAEDRLWDWSVTPSDLMLWQMNFCASLHRRGVPLGEVLRAQSGETLALAVRRLRLGGRLTEPLCREAFRVLIYDKLGSTLASVVTRWARATGGEPEELLATVRLKLLANGFDSYDPAQGMVAAYCAQAARNFMKDDAKKKRAGALDHPEAVAQRDADLEQDRAILLHDVRNAIKDLPEPERAVLEAFLALGAPPGHVIANHLGLPLWEVYRLLDRARQALVTRLRSVVAV